MYPPLLLFSLSNHFSLKIIDDFFVIFSLKSSLQLFFSLIYEFFFFNKMVFFNIDLGLLFVFSCFYYRSIAMCFVTNRVLCCGE